MRSTSREMRERISAPGIMITGTRSGVGKTTVSLGILGALAEKGIP